MNQVIRTTSLDEASRALAKALGSVLTGVVRGYAAAGLHVLRVSNMKCPVDTGNLRNSGFVVWSGGGKAHTAFSPKAKKDAPDNTQELKSSHAATVVAAEQLVESEFFKALPKPAVVIAYGAFYALYVHENLEASHQKFDRTGLKRATKKARTTGETVNPDDFLKQVGEARFLANALVQETQTIVQLIVEGGKR